jgi:hypothetical protein
MNKPILPNINTDMGKSIAPRCPEKYQVARLRLAKLDMLPGLILPVHLSREQNSILLIHIHNISGTVKSPGRCPAVTVWRTDIPLSRADNSYPFFPAVNPAVSIKTAPLNEGSCYHYGCNAQKNIFHGFFSFFAVETVLCAVWQAQ